MFPKSGSERLKSAVILDDAEFARAIGVALRSELGLSRRATKTVMMWANVSDRTARAWLNGLYSPSGRHLISLAANSAAVMSAMLGLAGRSDVQLSLELEALETILEATLLALREARPQRDQNKT